MRMNAPHEESVKIALIEPEPRHAVWIEELLLLAGVPAEVADVMACERPDIADAEIILIGLESLGALEREALTRLHAGFPQIPLVVLAGSDASSWAGEAVRLGAQHVLIKDELTSNKLASTIRYYAYYVVDRKGLTSDAWSRPMIPAPQFALLGP